jgi:hypothetical protein
MPILSLPQGGVYWRENAQAIAVQYSTLLLYLYSNRLIVRLAIIPLLILGYSRICIRCLSVRRTRTCTVDGL